MNLNNISAFNRLTELLDVPYLLLYLLIGYFQPFNFGFLVQVNFVGRSWGFDAAPGNSHVHRRLLAAVRFDLLNFAEQIPTL